MLNAKGSNTFIKVCGITCVEDAEFVSSQAVDAIGLVFYDKSPRAVSPEQAKTICDCVPSNIRKVGLFVNAEKDRIEAVLKEVPLDVLQFHGKESAEFCEVFDLPYWKAIQVREDTDLKKEMDDYSKAEYVLLDAWHPDLYGGTGQRFDWDLLDEGNDSAKDNTRNGAINRQRIILAGGLAPGNVAEAIRTVHPFGVDVSTGVESSPGRKSAQLVEQFVNEVKRV